MGADGSKGKPPGKGGGKRSAPFLPPAYLGLGQDHSAAGKGGRQKKGPPMTPSVRSKAPGGLKGGRAPIASRSVGQGPSPPKSVGRRSSSPGSFGGRGSASRSASTQRPQNVRRMRGSSAVTTAVVFGRQEKTLSVRQRHPYDAHTMKRPTVMKGSLWKDYKFPFTVDQDKKEKPVKVSWKRPMEFAPGCRLFPDTLNRYSVKQGQVGDCFYISTLSAMADEPKLIKQVMPRDAYVTDRGKYTGIFHCRFWWMGEWIDVYTDDILPYNEDNKKPYGGRSDDPKVVWVPLMEKALARLCGGYKNVQGDQSHAYSLLTGGIVDKIKIRKRESNDVVPPPGWMFARINDALDSGAIVLTSIDQGEGSNPLLKGLTTNHSYAIHDAIKIKHGKETVMLLRIRNPWGETNKVKPVNENGEWKGRWSYRSSEWKEVSKDLSKRHNVEFEKGGEFWVCMEDFYKIFEHIYIADTIPNFDQKGFKKSNHLNHVFNILGDWDGDTAAGSEWKNLFYNPLFVLIVSNKGVKGNRVPTVIQLILQHDHPVKDTPNVDNLYCRVDVFREEAQEIIHQRLLMSLTALSVSDIYLASRENTRLHRLTPGRYILIPNFLEENRKKRVSQAFCLRVFTSNEVKCRELNADAVALTGKPCETFENEDGTPKKQAFRTVTVFGEWRGETAAGSDPVNRMKNPRFLLTIPGKAKVKVVFQLRQRRDIDATLHVRLDVFQINPNLTWAQGRWVMMCQITNMETFMAGGEVSYDYELGAGRYLLLPNYSSKERINSAFCIRILAPLQVHCKPHLDGSVLFIRSSERILKHGNKSYDLGVTYCLFGAWVKNDTAGGQISYDTFADNPQFGLTVEGHSPQPFRIELVQECIQPVLAIGCFVVKSVEGQESPMDNKQLKSSAARVNTIDGKSHSFIQSTISTGYYMLNPGRYVVVVYADKPTDEKRFALVIAYQGPSKPTLKESKKDLSKHR